MRTFFLFLFLGLNSIFRKISTKEEVRTFLEPQQLGMSVAGAQKFVISVRSLLNHRQDFICVKIDFRNAYNELSRRAIIDAFVDEPTLRHLAHFCAVGRVLRGNEKVCCGICFSCLLGNRPLFG